ncbi:DUF6118 family protein [Rhizosaccharibacter radicis]|uniref:DUF6118 family protein n=1 Tax=Rhizosaccharibacter radicis TaxID=2782605 RepID=A0ABT1W0Q5_9PROT|nr:DUF6118 family protein [Acetobacteraceae bacterium KSS12]
MDDEAGHRRPGDVTQAFEDLRAEVSVLRRAVEALPSAWHESPPPDYSPNLGRTEGAGGRGNTDPGDQHAPGAAADAPAAPGRGGAGRSTLLREAAQKLERATQEVGAERKRLADLVGTMHGQDQQRFWLIFMGVIALVVGMIFSPLLAARLPLELNGRVAALIMEQQDRWNAGIALMQAESPQGWQEVADASQLLGANQKAIEACSEAAQPRPGGSRPAPSW